MPCALHESVVAQVMIYLVNLLLISSLIGKVTPYCTLTEGFHQSLGHIDGNTCYGQVVRIAAEIDLHYTACSCGQSLVTQFVCTSAWYRWQLEHDVIMTDGLHLILGIVGPVDFIAIEVDEVGVIAHDAHVAEVAVVFISRNVHMLIAVLGGLGTSNAVGGSFGEESHSIKSYSFAMQIVSHLIVV